MTGHQSTDALRDVVRDPLASAGLDVEDVEISTAGRRRVVRVLVDRDGGVTLDEIATASSLVAAALDDSDVLGERPYTLEVTSPGIDRPLTAPRHWRRNAGRLVAVTLRDGSALTGRVVSASEEGAVLEPAGPAGRETPTEPVELAYADVATARVEVEFSRPSREG